jgi:hypothetical protein
MIRRWLNFGITLFKTGRILDKLLIRLLTIGCLELDFEIYLKRFPEWGGDLIDGSV